MRQGGWLDRRGFLGALGAATVASGCTYPLDACRTPAKFKLGVAGITLHGFKLDEALAYLQAHGFHYLCVKDFHLPYSATPAEMAVFRAKLADHGVTPYGVGPVTITCADEARQMFDYAATLGVSMIVGVPARQEGKGWAGLRSDRKMCEFCSGLADEYRIRFAIHNHGRNPKTGNPQLYPAVPETHEYIKDLSPRMGLCVDWAYTFADGLDCLAVAHKYGDRIFDGHVRCLKSLDNGSVSTSPSDQCFSYEGIFAALKEIGYSGFLGLECVDAFRSNHPEWVDESKRYFEGLM